MLYDDNKLSDIEFSIYNTWFDEFIQEIPKLYTVYLKTMLDTANLRVKKRSRVGEDIELGYLEKCSAYHDKWLLGNDNNMTIHADSDFEKKPDTPFLYKSGINL